MIGIKSFQILFRIFIRIQGAAMAAYREYVAIAATKKADEKANNMGGFVLIMGLNS